MARSGVQFAELGLSPSLLAAVRQAGYETPTPIQEKAIPPVLAGRDLLGLAQTGTGKTAAFALPMVQLIRSRSEGPPRLRGLVITPTRELAAQIDESFAAYSHGVEIWHTVIFGGVNQNKQVKELQDGVDVLVATPGRLLDLMQQRHVNLCDVEIFVLDEADRMLDMGFLPDVKRIADAVPRQRQTLLFSATMPDEIRSLANSLLRNPVTVSVARTSAAAEGIDHRVYFVEKKDKRNLLVELLRDASLHRTLVFTRTKHGANRVAQQLMKAKIKAAAIHSNKSQGARLRALGDFKRGAVEVLVATDIAARGIDVDAVSHVINFDIPNVPETYVHRAGRTARAGATGVALSFCDVDERPFLVDVERLIGRHLQRMAEHPHASPTPPPPETDLNPKSRARSPSAPRAAQRPQGPPRTEGPPRGFRHRRRRPPRRTR